MIQEEVRSCVVGKQLNPKELNEVAVGVLQLAIDDFAGNNGVPSSTSRFCTRLARKQLLYEDRSEIVQNMSVKIHVKVMSFLPRTYLEHRFAYKTLYTGNILVGLDPREFVNEPDDVSSAVRYTETI